MLFFTPSSILTVPFIQSARLYLVGRKGYMQLPQGRDLYTNYVMPSEGIDLGLAKAHIADDTIVE